MKRTRDFPIHISPFAKKYKAEQQLVEKDLNRTITRIGSLSKFSCCPTYPFRPCFPLAKSLDDFPTQEALKVIHHAGPSMHDIFKVVLLQVPLIDLHSHPNYRGLREIVQLNLPMLGHELKNIMYHPTQGLFHYNHYQFLLKYAFIYWDNDLERWTPEIKDMPLVAKQLDFDLDE